jgi:hypothetical protein
MGPPSRIAGCAPEKLLSELVVEWDSYRVCDKRSRLESAEIVPDGPLPAYDMSEWRFVGEPWHTAP